MRTLKFRQSCDKSQWAQQLAQRLIKCPEDDISSQMDALREFKSLCLQQITKNQELSALNDLAEVLLEKIYQLSLQHMRSQYGAEDPLPFGIIAYGNLGSRELHFHSDLDLVFLYDSPKKWDFHNQIVLSEEEFSIKLAQRVIHLLDSTTTFGKLYEVDVRLRPEGNAGLLASHIQAFEKYLREHAWTYEHQALVKARMVVGSADLARKFETLRSQTLAKPRDPDLLAEQIRQMREKMLACHAKKEDPKFMKSGLADIEFIVQYAILRWSWQYPALLQERNTIKNLRQLAQYRLLSRENADKLLKAYREFQDFSHNAEKSSAHDKQQIKTHQENVEKIWHELF